MASSVERFRVGDVEIHVHTFGCLLVMTHGRHMVEIAVAHADDEDLTRPTPPAPPRYRLRDDPEVQARRAAAAAQGPYSRTVPT
jgi:hypothetical protein